MLVSGEAAVEVERGLRLRRVPGGEAHAVAPGTLGIDVIEAARGGGLVVEIIYETLFHFFSCLLNEEKWDHVLFDPASPSSTVSRWGFRFLRRIVCFD